MNSRIISIQVIKEDNEPTLQTIRDIDDLPVLDNIPLTTGFGVYKANEFLRSLNTGLAIKFENYYQYNELIKNVNKILETIREDL
ncbi:hypothetical protein IO99_17935 [Clostridium sulfidigenes]|uniref:Uncharacterized protein n=1 Tax=Clostridium sulfidigenes TaxID=318464 RepID=A0A084J7E9_9CLOT|nr:hypothetical protein [Clostridium sulfidigenes]KEZ84883.1 hypothetical protein IO99_17935 [Clostridium sulfidigenes]